MAAGSAHSRDTIANRLRGAGASLRKPGTRKRNAPGTLICSPEALVALIRAKRCEGLTYREIANHLMGKNVALNTRSVNWHPMMVKRLLEKNYPR